MIFDLELNAVGKVYDNGTPAVIDFNLSVNKGEFIAFLTALALMYAPIKKLNKVNLSLNTALSAAERVFRMLDVENDVTNYNRPQPALQPLVDTGNLGLSYSDSSINVWLLDQSPAKVAEAAAIMEDMPDVTAVWRRDGNHYTRVTPVRWDLMATQAERTWFNQHAQELIDTQRATDLRGAAHVAAACGLAHLLEAEHGVDIGGAHHLTPRQAIHRAHQQLVEDAHRVGRHALGGERQDGELGSRGLEYEEDGEAREHDRSRELSDRRATRKVTVRRR